MLFNSFAFLAFFLVVFGVYLRLGHKGQNIWLLLGSYAFYAAWDWRFLGLILISTIIDFVAGLRIHGSANLRHRRAWLTASLAVNVALLATFKYFDFFADNLAALLGLVGIEIGPVSLGLVLPVGISFYTFQTMSYSLDIHRGRMAPTRNFLDFALFVAFFPQLLAGPIERARNLLPQIQAPRHVGLEDVYAGGHLVFWGLLQKVFVADNLGRLVDAIFSATYHDTASVIVGSWAFLFQVFCDFAGYSNIARGVGRMMGFEITVNFDAPYVRPNPTAQWSRWHISLATWFRDYLFRPLVRTRLVGPHVALLFTWALIGLWHGAAWHFVAFGLFTGSYLVAHRALRRHIRLPGPAWLQYTIGTLIAVNLSAASAFLFRVDDWQTAASMIGALFSGPLASDALCGQLGHLLFYGWPVVVGQVAQAVRNDTAWLLTTGRATRTVAYVIGFYLILWFGSTGGRPFVYYQF